MIKCILSKQEFRQVLDQDIKHLLFPKIYCKSHDTFNKFDCEILKRLIKEAQL